MGPGASRNLGPGPCCARGRKSAARVGFVMARIVGSACLVCLLATWNAAAVDRAAVTETLRNDIAYATYAKIQIQLEMLANPSTASSSVIVDSPLPGVIDLRGTVPDQRIKDVIVQTADRVSGLRVRQTLRIVPTAPIKNADAEARQNLVPSCKETLVALFPNSGPNVTVSANRDGVVTLTGVAPSYEACLLICQTAKSQPGCSAVVCKLQVPIEKATQKIKVTEDGAEQLFAAQLPAIPPASATSTILPEDKFLDRPTDLARMAADDAPPENQADRQLLDDLRARFERDAELKRLNFEIDVQQGVVSLSANTQSRAQVELAVATAGESPGVTKVTAKCRPVSILRYRPKSYDADPSKPSASTMKTPQKKLLWVIPWGGSDYKPVSAPVTNGRYREAIRKNLQKRCEKDCTDLSVKVSADGKGLLIEGKTPNPQRRVAVFKQLENVAELRGVAFDAVMQITESE
jgi:osmotically-inducible protein OsmY